MVPITRAAMDDSKQTNVGKRALESPDDDMAPKRSRLNDASVGVPDQRYEELQKKFAALERERDQFTKQNSELSRQAAEASKLLKEKDEMATQIAQTKKEYLTAMEKRGMDPAYLKSLADQPLENVRLARTAFLGFAKAHKPAPTPAPQSTQPAIQPKARIYDDRYENELKQNNNNNGKSERLLAMSDIVNASKEARAANEDTAVKSCYSDFFINNSASAVELQWNRPTSAYSIRRV